VIRRIRCVVRVTVSRAGLPPEVTITADGECWHAVGAEAALFAPPFAVEALRSHHAKQTQNRHMFGSDYPIRPGLGFRNAGRGVFETRLGNHEGLATCTKLGFPKGVSLHTLRHTHGSHLLSIGVPLPTFSKRLGHGNRHITATIYSHALEKDEQAPAEAWERAMAISGKLEC
jgi:integrase